MTENRHRIDETFLDEVREELGFDEDDPFWQACREELEEGEEIIIVMPRRSTTDEPTGGEDD